MKSNRILLDADLTLFDGEGAGEASAQGGTMGDNEEVMPDNTQPEDIASGADAADTRADEEGDTHVTSNTLEDRRKAYEDLIKGEYKDLYTQDTQKIIDRRFRETKELEQQLSANKDIMDMLMQRYGVNDTQALSQAIENDDGYWEQAAMDAGMSVDQYKAFSRLERENKALLQAQAERQNQERVNRQLEQWYREAEDLNQKLSARTW